METPETSSVLDWTLYLPYKYKRQLKCGASAYCICSMRSAYSGFPDLTNALHKSSKKANLSWKVSQSKVEAVCAAATADEYFWLSNRQVISTKWPCALLGCC